MQPRWKILFGLCAAVFCCGRFLSSLENTRLAARWVEWEGKYYTEDEDEQDDAVWLRHHRWHHDSALTGKSTAGGGHGQSTLPPDNVHMKEASLEKCGAHAILYAALYRKNLFSSALVSPPPGSVLEGMAVKLDLLLAGSATSDTFVALSYVMKNVFVHLSHILDTHESEFVTPAEAHPLPLVLFTGPEGQALSATLDTLDEDQHCIALPMKRRFGEGALLSPSQLEHIAAGSQGLFGNTLLVSTSVHSKDDVLQCMTDQLSAMISISLLEWGADTQIIVIQPPIGERGYAIHSDATIDSVCSSLWSRISSKPVWHFASVPNLPIFLENTAFSVSRSCSPIFDRNMLACPPHDGLRELFEDFDYNKFGETREANYCHVVWLKSTEPPKLHDDAGLEQELRKLQETSGGRVLVNIVADVGFDDLMLLAANTDVLISFPTANFASMMMLPRGSTAIELSNEPESVFHVMSHSLGLFHSSVGLQERGSGEYEASIHQILDAVEDGVSRCK
eukprot:TRINITY_DN2001_c0_g1_i1.p1 TRINITY_DN2001_c0_g1~~TRINITY_DN2001_c0_g1_i1.p1  ORF type:complete len:507 (+),score=109.09 TRINITY_DN2001_c0_g1_i1:263-1783(+)